MWPQKIVVQLQHTKKVQFSSLEKFTATAELAPGKFQPLQTKQFIKPENWVQVEIYLDPPARGAHMIHMEWIAQYRI